MSIIPPRPADAVITLEYEPDAGVDWADMWDNNVMGWSVADDGSTPPVPVILGTFPPEPPDSGEVISPAWVSVFGTWAIVPDKWRGRLLDLFDFLSKNNGAQRKLRGNFQTRDVSVAWQAWVSANPELVWEGPPPPLPPEEEDGLPKEGFAGYEAGALERVHATGDAEQEQEQTA